MIALAPDRRPLGILDLDLAFDRHFDGRSFTETERGFDCQTS